VPADAPEEIEDRTFTDFMIRAMESQQDVEQALVIYRRSDGSFGYKAWNQAVMDTLGMLRFCAMSVEHYAVKVWNEEDED